ncbi:MAG: PaaI family thioesterase [Thermoanaerobaculia bacterium]
MIGDPVDRPPQLVVPAGWVALEPPRLEGGEGSFVSGGDASGRLRVRYFRRPGAPGLAGRAWFGRGAAGPPGHAHGGAIAAVLDEAMGAVAWTEGHCVVAVRLETDFRRLVPLGTDAHLEARVGEIEGRKVNATARLVDERGELFAEARGLFVTLDPVRFADLLAAAAASFGLDPAELARRFSAP